MTEQPIKISKVKSSDGEREYTVQVFNTFSTCTCEGFAHRQTCKHIAQAAKPRETDQFPRKPTMKESVLTILQAREGEQIDSKIQDNSPCAEYRILGKPKPATCDIDLVDMEDAMIADMQKIKGQQLKLI